MTDPTKSPMTCSGFCEFPSTPGHDGCRRDGCACDCHDTKEKT